MTTTNNKIKCVMCGKHFEIPENATVEKQPWIFINVGPDCYSKILNPEKINGEYVYRGPLFLEPQIQSLYKSLITIDLNAHGADESNQMGAAVSSMLATYNLILLCKSYTVDPAGEMSEMIDAIKNQINKTIDLFVGNGGYTKESGDFLKERNEELSLGIKDNIEENYLPLVQAYNQELLKHGLGLDINGHYDINDARLDLLDNNGAFAAPMLRAGLVPDSYAEMCAAFLVNNSIVNYIKAGICHPNADQVRSFHSYGTQFEFTHGEVNCFILSDVGYGGDLVETENAKGEPLAKPAIRRSSRTSNLIRSKLLCSISKNEDARMIAAKSFKRISIQEPEDRELIWQAEEEFQKNVSGKLAEMNWNDTIYEAKAFEIAIQADNFQEAFPPCSVAPMVFKNILLGAKNLNGTNAMSIIVTDENDIQVKFHKAPGKSSMEGAAKIYKELASEVGESRNEFALDKNVFVLFSPEAKDNYKVSQHCFTSEAISNDMMRLRNIRDDEVIKHDGLNLATVQTYAHETRSLSHESVLATSNDPIIKENFTELDAKFFGCAGTTASVKTFDERGRFNLEYPCPNEKEREYFIEKTKKNPNHTSMLNNIGAYIDSVRAKKNENKKIG